MILNANRRVLTRPAKNGLNGNDLELTPTSVSKGETGRDELMKTGAESKGTVSSNLRRVGGGVMEVWVQSVDFADNAPGAMTIADFKAESQDGRSLAALAKAGL